MTLTSLKNPVPVFNDAKGNPLTGGRVYLGTAGLDPETNPVALYWDAAGTLPAAQPLTCKGGYIANSGTPARVYCPIQVSIRVYDQLGAVVFYNATVVIPDDAPTDAGISASAAAASANAAANSATASSTSATNAGASATLAGHYANDSTNVDVPGGASGSRGAKYWSNLAAAAAAGATAPVATVANKMLPQDRNIVDPTTWTANKVLNSGTGAADADGSNTRSVSDFIPVEPSTTYTTLTDLSGNNPTIWGYSGASEAATVGSINTGGLFAPGTFATGATVTHIRLCVTSTTIPTIDIYKGNLTRKVGRKFPFLEEGGVSDIVGDIAGPAHSSGMSKVSLLNRAMINLTGTLDSNHGTFTSGAGDLFGLAVTDLFPVSTRTGVAPAHDQVFAGNFLFFYDRAGTPIMRSDASFTATFVAGSPNFTIGSFSNIGGLAFRPPGAPAFTAPALVGHWLYDTTNNNNGSVIPLRAVIGAAAAPYSTTGTYTMVDETGAPVNAVSSATVTVSGALLAGVPLVPPTGYGICRARYSQIAGANGVYLDDWELMNFNFAKASERRTLTGTFSGVQYQLSSHHLALGFGEGPLDKPLFGKKLAIFGNSIGADPMWTKYLAWATRAKIMNRLAVGGTQAHEFLFGGNSDPENWNLVTGNVSGPVVAGDLAGIDYALIVCPSTNSQGYRSGTTLTDGGAGFGYKQQYPLGAFGDVAPVSVVTVTTATGNPVITVAVASGNVIVAGAQFPVGAPGGLGGKFILAFGTSGTSGTGGAGTYAVGNTAGGAADGTGVLGGVGLRTIVGTYYGTLHWLCETLRGFNPATIPVIMTALPRLDCGTGNGGVGGSDIDPANFGNPINVNGVRLSQYVDAEIDFARRRKIPLIECFYNGPFSSANWATKMSDGLHPTPTGNNPTGSRTLAAKAAYELPAFAVQY